jgi:hypothetical protein
VINRLSLVLSSPRTSEITEVIGCPSPETEYPSRCDGHSRQAAEATVNGHSLNRLSNRLSESGAGWEGAGAIPGNGRQP